MGQKDHEETADAQILDGGLDPGLDLVYLHLSGPTHCPPAMEDRASEPQEGEEEREEREEPKPEQRSEGGVNQVKPLHQPLCRTQCVDLGPDGPPDLPQELKRNPVPPNPAENDPHSPEKSAEPSPDKTAEGSKEYQTKLDFALKLGYSEEMVRAVLTKLGSQTLINDVLGELVRLGTKAEPDQDLESALGSGLGSGPGSSCGCIDEVRADSPVLSESVCDRENLRPIVVDGSNVAMSHGNKEVFSCQGIQLAVDWFLERGHHDITVFVPAWRKEQSRPDAPITEQEILRRLEKQKVLVFTPSRRVQGRRVVCYDDRFIVKLAYESDGIIVSNDNYRDLGNEKPEWKRFIDERLLMYSFVNDKFMPPDDPLGRHGPSLDNFLRKRPVMPEQKKQPCPYGKKCTYGHKCKYYHPERGAQPQRAVADELRASAKTCLTPKNSTKNQTKIQTDPGLVKSHSVPTGEAQKNGPKRQSDPSVRALSYSDAEEKLLLQTQSRTMSPAPGGPPTTASLPQDEFSRSGTPLGHTPDTPYPYCHSPEYYSVSRAFSGLSFCASRPNHDHRPDFRPLQDCRPAQDQDYRLGSLGSMGSAGSECGSESSSCDSCPPDSLIDDFHHPPSRMWPHLSGSAHDYCPHPHSNEYPYLPPLHPDTLPKRPLYPLPAHLKHQPLSARSSCPVDYHHAPVPSASCSPLAESISDSHLYDRFAHHPRPKTLPHWDTYYRPPTRYDTSSCYWEGYGPHYHQYPQQSALLGRSSRSVPPYSPPRPDSPAHTRFSDAREKAFVNLCNIFPSELVSRVMSRCPHIADPQQLAAAILAEKAQAGF